MGERVRQAHLLEREHAARANESAQRLQYGDWVGHKRENESPDRGVERLARRQISNVGLKEPNVLEPGGFGSLAGVGQHEGVSINADDSTRGPDEPGREHCDIAHAASKIEHAHAVPDASFLKQTFRERLEQPSLAHEAQMLRFNGIRPGRRSEFLAP